MSASRMSSWLPLRALPEQADSRLVVRDPADVPDVPRIAK
jgi:hypothetical protein